MPFSRKLRYPTGFLLFALVAFSLTSAFGVFSPSAKVGSLASARLFLNSTSASSRGFWAGRVVLSGTTATALVSNTYDNVSCTGTPTAVSKITSQQASKSSDLNVQGATPMGVRRFSAQVTASTPEGTLTTSCQTLSVVGPATPKPVMLVSSTSAAAPYTPYIALTPRYTSFPNNVLWSGTVNFAGGMSPGGTLTLFSYTGSSCSTQSNWQTSVNFSPGGMPSNYTFVGYALPTAGNYSVRVQYSGDSNNNSSNSPCVAYSVTSTPTSDSLTFNEATTSSSPNQNTNFTVSASGLTGNTETLIEADMSPNSCSYSTSSSWVYPVSYQSSASYVTNLTVPKPGSYGFKATLFPDTENSGKTTSCSTLVSTAGSYNSAGDFFPLAPFRVLDTRVGNGAPQAPVGPGGSFDVQVTGVPGSGVPASGVSAVVLNVTVDGPTGPSFLAVWPQGQPRPLVSNLNFSAGQTIPNLVTVRVGVNGQVSIFNNGGNVSVIADVMGYYSDGTTFPGNRLSSTSPFRILDTRNGQGAPARPVGQSSSIDLTVAGANNIPAGAVAVVLNVTVTDTTSSSYLTVWPTGTPRPVASNLNWTAGKTIPNQVVAKIGANGQVSIFNFAGNTDVVADVMGWYMSSYSNPSGLQYFAVTPFRAVDGRNCDFIAASYAASLPGCPQSISGGTSEDAFVTGNGVPNDAAAVLVNTTVTETTGSSYLTVWPSGQSQPLASNLNWTSGDTIPNLVLAAVGYGNGGSGEVNVYNNGGQADVILDVAGYFQ